MQINKRYWLNGSVIGLVVGLVIVFGYRLGITQMHIFEGVFLVLYYISNFGWRIGVLLLGGPQHAFYILHFLPLLTLTLYGAILGWLYGKIKSKISNNKN